MKVRLILSLVLVIGMLPVASAYVAPPNSPDASTADAADVPEQPITETQVAGDAGEAADAGDADDAGQADDADEGNFTKLYVDSDDSRLDVKPGESAEFTVSVKNHEDEAVDVSPHLRVPPVGENLLDESWVDIEVDETTIEAGETVEFDVSVDVPDDAELGRYEGHVAVTDEEVTYPGRPARPVHAASVYMNVQKEPTVHVSSSTYLHAQAEAGDAVTREIVVENTGEESTPVNPELEGDDLGHGIHGTSTAIDASWIDVDAPTEIAPGETETIEITLSPPEDTETGRYDASIDLGLKDPARDDRSSYWQNVDLNLEVWSQPDEPFVTSFDVSDRAESVTVELTPQSTSYHVESSDSDPASFDVAFVGPDGERVEAERVQVTDGGSVDLSADDRAPYADEDGEYAVRHSGTEFVYELDDPEDGTWQLEVVPENAIGFDYQITRDESSD